MKNNRIQFWRIVFTYVIAIYHFNNAYKLNTSWYIAVEFFFILSGFLMASKLERERSSGEIESTFSYTFKKIKTFYPHYIFSFIVVFFGYGYLNNYGINDYVDSAISHWDEILLIQSAGWNKPTSAYLNSPTWYISTLLIVGLLVWWLLKKYRNAFLKVIAPILIVAIYVYFFKVYGDVNEHRKTVHIILNSALMRGFAALSLGIIGYYLSVHLKKIVKKGVLFALLSDACFVAVIILSFIHNRTTWDFIFVPLLFLGVVFGFSTSFVPKYLNNRIIEFMGEITYPIYLNHKFFRVIFPKFFDSLNLKVYLIYILVITIYSICTYYFVKIVGKIFKKVFSKNEAN